MNNTPSPGWYPDNVGSGQRYWDGRQWTEHTAPDNRESQRGHPARAETAIPVRASTGASQANWFLRHKVISGVAASVLLLGAVGAIIGPEEDPDSGASDTSAQGDEVPIADLAPSSEPEPVDTDGDGVVDDDDFSPDDAQVQTEDDIDTDRDGVPDYQDLRPEDRKIQTQDDVDTDKDGVPDYKDDFPRDAQYSKDTDGDRVADQVDDFPRDAEYHTDTDGDRVADSVDAFPGDPSRSKITLAMENALESAFNYLDLSGFSRLGLINQLSSEYGEGYKVEDATWAVDQTGADWNKEAVEAARNYLSFTSFSRQGLIDQLSSAYGEQFTIEEATYAVNKIGL